MLGLSRLKASLSLFCRNKSSKSEEVRHDVDVQVTEAVPSTVTTLNNNSSESSDNTSNSLVVPQSRSQEQLSKPFRREDKAQRERDLKRLAVAFILSENRDLKDAVILTTRVTNFKFKDADFTTKINTLSTRFGSLIGGISDSSLHNAKIVELSEATKISAYLSLLRQLEAQLEAADYDALNDIQQRSIDDMVSALISKLEAIMARNSLTSDRKMNENMDSQRRIDSTIDSAITILSIAQDACGFVPPSCVKTSVTLACSLLKAVKKTRSNYEDMKEISVTAAEFVLSLTVLVMENEAVLSETLENALDEFTSNLKDVVTSCLRLTEKSLAFRFLQQGNDGEDVLRLKFDLQKAIERFQLKAQILQFADFHSFSKIVIEKMDGDIIRSLPDTEFFEGTRDDFFPGIHDDVLTQIGTWIEDPLFPVLWICGSAGMGKSSIAHQLVYHLIDAGRLGAQTFFIRGSEIQRNLVTVIHSLARELASTHTRTIPEIANVIRLGNSKHQELSVYLKKYIVDPIQSLSLSHPLVVILDALDECKNSNLLIKAISEIPDLSGVKILVTSRPEPQISTAIGAIGTGVQKINLQRLSDTKMERYISSRFAKIVWHDQQPSKNDLSGLAKLSNGLIIYAATACNFLGNEMQEEEAYQLLQKIVTCSNSQDIAAERQLTSLYHATLSHLFKGKDITSFHQVFEPMYVVQDSMTVEIFAKTFKLGVRQTKAVHSALVSLQIYDASDGDTILPAVQRFHSSFLDYIAHSELKSLSGEFHVDPFFAHSTASQRCLSQFRDFMATTPGHQVPSSYYDLERPVRYSVCHWPFHLTEAALRDSPSTPHNDCSSSLKQLMNNGMPIWTPFYLLASQAFTTALEGVGSIKDVERAIIFHTRSLQLFDATGSDQSRALSDFGFAIWKRYYQCGSPEDLERSISMQSKFLKLSSHQTHARARALYRLGIALHARFMSPNSYDGDLDRSIEMLREALEIYSKLGENDFHASIALASSVRTRFENIGVQSDLNDAISMIQRAIAMPHIGYFDRTRALNNLAICLISRFEINTTISDLDQAVELLSEVLDSRPEGHPHRASTLNNLALCLQLRFEITGDLEILQKATEMHFEVLALRPDPHRHRDQTMANIAKCLRARFEKQGSLSDIEEAIFYSTKALDMRPIRSLFHAMSLNCLGRNLYARFQISGDDADIAEAVALLLRAVENSLPSDERDLPEYLQTLAEALGSRFQHKGVQKDLDDCVSMHEKALTLCNSGTSTHCISLNGLSTALLAKYKQNHSQDLLQTIDNITRKALPLIAASHLYPIQARNNRAQTLYYLYQQTRRQEDLSGAHDLYSAALRLCPPGHPSRPFTLEGFSRVLHSRFEYTNSIEDLNRYIDLLRERFFLFSSSCSTRGHSESGEMLVNALKTRFDRVGDGEDLVEVDRILHVHED